MKTFCIEFERECEGKDVIHHKAETKPTRSEAEGLIDAAGYIFNPGYDVIRAIYEV